MLSDDGDETFLFMNNEKEPTLRLDYTFNNGVLIQYRSKEYGFVDNMPEEWITNQEAEELVRKFALEFLGISENPIPTEAPISYRDIKEYAAYRDSKGGSYLVQLNHNMVIHYDALEEE